MNNAAMNIKMCSAVCTYKSERVVCTFCATSCLSRAFLWLLPHLSPLSTTQHDPHLASLGDPQTGYCQHHLRGPVLLHSGFHAAAPQSQTSKHFFHVFAGH